MHDRSKDTSEVRQTSVGPQSGAETCAWKVRALATPRGLADIYVGVKHVSSLLSDYCKIQFCCKILNKTVL